MSGLPLGLVYAGNQVQMQTCAMDATHKHPMVEAHHVCPESWWLAAHKAVSSPMLILCPSCHYGTHVCIDGLLHKKDISLMYPSWVSCAQRAFVIAAANGLTPARTL